MRLLLTEQDQAEAREATVGCWSHRELQLPIVLPHEMGSLSLTSSDLPGRGLGRAFSRT